MVYQSYITEVDFDLSRIQEHKSENEILRFFYLSWRISVYRTFGAIKETIFQKEQKKEIRILRKANKKLTQSPSIDGMEFVQIYVDKTEVAFCIYVAFAVNPDLSSQQGIILMLRETKSGAVNGF